MDDLEKESCEESKDLEVIMNEQSFVLENSGKKRQ